jgi:hypothetical protein
MIAAYPREHNGVSREACRLLQFLEPHQPGKLGNSLGTSPLQPFLPESGCIVQKEGTVTKLALEARQAHGQDIMPRFAQSSLLVRVCQTHRAETGEQRMIEMIAAGIDAPVCVGGVLIRAWGEIV